MTRVLLEVCVDGLDGALASVEAGADRLEVNLALEAGGLTPSAGLLAAVRGATTCPIVAMVRPRAGGFRYGPAELAVAADDARRLADLGADALAFGALDGAGRLDEAACARVLGAAPGLPFVLHRAFDLAADHAAALEQAIGLGFARILTAGGGADAGAGIVALAALREQAAGRIEVLPGGGIGPVNAAVIVRATGCCAVHGSFSRAVTEEGAGLYAAARRETDPAAVAATRRALDGA